MNLAKLNSNYLNPKILNDKNYLASSWANLKPLKKGAKLRILCALNSKAKRNKIGRILENKKCELDFAQNGWFCIQKAHNAKVKKKPYNLVIVSAGLKVLDGFTVATKLANLKLTDQIIITSSDQFYSYELDSLTTSGANYLSFANLTDMLEDS